jgi:NAD-dependent dihydropyrimidine dehydrogenase PreA subunit
VDLLTIDRTLCTGCGTCLDACPTGAISLNDDDRIATIDLGVCNECLVCLDMCANGAIRLSELSELVPAMPREVVEGEVVEEEIIPAPVTGAPVATWQPRPLVALAGSALSFVGSWLLPRAADALVDAVDRRLAQGGGSAPSTTNLRSSPQISMRRKGGGRGGRSRQRRRRRRGK